MNQPAPAFATGTRVVGAVLIAGYLSGLVPGAVVSIIGGLALVTFGRALLLDRAGTAVSGAALAVTAGALGVASLRWGTLSLDELVGAQSVLGPSIVVGPTGAAIASIVALSSGVVAIAAWAIEPRGIDRLSRSWSRAEAVLGVLAATLVFAAPGVGGSFGELLASPDELVTTAGVAIGASAIVLIAPRVLGSRRLRWAAIAVSGTAVVASAGVVASAL